MRERQKEHEVTITANKELASKLPQDEITPEERKEQAAKLAEAAAK